MTYRITYTEGNKAAKRWATDFAKRMRKNAPKCKIVVQTHRRPE